MSGCSRWNFSGGLPETSYCHPGIAGGSPAYASFIDETWTKTNMTRLHGWALRGERLIAKVPNGHWKTTTFLAALRSDRIDAFCLFDGGPYGARGQRDAVGAFFAAALGRT